MQTAKEIIGQHIPAFFARPDNGKLIDAAVDRAHARLRALRASYDDQCSRIAVELQREVRAIERGW